MPMNRRSSPVRTNNFLDENPEYHLKYYELIKEARIWNNSGQYWLGKEATRRANCLHQGDIAGYEKVTHSEELHYPGVVMNM